MGKRLNNYYSVLAKDDFALIAISSFVVWIIIQLFLVGFLFDHPQFSDAGRYQSIALECYNHGKWYPTYEQVESQRYIFNPGYVNFLILQLNVLGSLKYCSFLNFILNIIFILLVKSIISKLVCNSAGNLSVLLFCLLPSNYLSVIVTATELLNAVVLIGALALINKSSAFLICSAFLIILAEYIRPSIIIFLPSILLYFWKKKIGIKLSALFLCSLIGFYIGLTALVKHVTSANQLYGTTSGVNMIMGANDNMTGRFFPDVFEKGKLGYIDGEINAYQTDSVLRRRALSWIKDHPYKFLSYVPNKLFYLWFQDESWVEVFKPGKPKTYLLFKTELPYDKIISILFMNTGYYFVLSLSIFGFFKNKKRLLSLDGLIVLMPIAINSLIIIFTVGAARYHFSCNVILIMLATLSYFSENAKENKTIIG